MDVKTNAKPVSSNTVKPAYAVTSIKQPPVLIGHIFLDLSGENYLNFFL
jgi:hypothetical protein